MLKTYYFAYGDPTPTAAEIVIINDFEIAAYGYNLENHRTKDNPQC
jgi:hypothetical protein